MTSHWFILKADGNVYGPATLTKLKEWVSDGRVEPDDQLSPDQETWTPAIEYAELEMEYIILFSENQLYGPVHRAVLDQLIKDGDIDADQLVRHASSGRELTAREALDGNRSQSPTSNLSDHSAPAAPIAQSQRAGEGDRAIAIAEARAETAADYYQRLQLLESDKKALTAAVHAKTQELEEVKQAAQGARLEILHSKKAEIATLRDRIKELEDQQQAATHASAEVDRATLQALELKVGELKGERDEARTQVVEQAHELQRIEERAADLEQQLVDALAHVNTSPKAESADPAASAGLAQELSEAQLELERVQHEKNAEIIALQKQLTQLKEQMEATERQPNSDESKSSEADETIQALQRAWDDDKAAWTKREQQMKQRLAQFEGELKEKMAAFVEAKQVATSRPQEGAQTSAAVQVPSVPRAALSRLLEQAATGMAAIHRPAPQTQRAAALTRVRVPPKKNKGKRPPVAGRR